MSTMSWQKIAIVFFILAVSSTAWALTPQINEFSADFGSEVSIGLNQTAKYTDGSSLITVNAKNIVHNTCDLNADANTVCIEMVSSAEFLIGGCTTSPGLVGCMTPQNVNLTIGQSDSFSALNGKYSIFLANIVSTTVPAQDGNIQQGSPRAIIVVKKLDSPNDVIVVNLGEAFNLARNQSAKVQNENFKITLNSIIYPQPCTGEVCTMVYYSPYVKLTASQERDSTGVATEFLLREGEKTEIFGYTIENKSVSGENAAFTITKQSNPNHITVKLDEKFDLVLNQTASIQQNASTVAKMTLEKIYVGSSACKEESPCAVFKSASISFSLPGGIGTGMTIREGEVQSINDKLEVYCSFIGDKSATFAVRQKNLPPDTIVVGLNSDFDLKQSQTAIVKETRLQLQFVKWRTVSGTCTQPMDGSKPAVCSSDRREAMFMVKQPVEKYLNTVEINTAGSGSSTVTGRVAVPTVLATTSEIVQESVSAPTLVAPYPYVNILEGETVTVFGHQVRLNRLAIDQSLCPQNTVCETPQAATANLRVSKQTEPDYIKVNLNEKFKLLTGQTAWVLEPVSSYQPAVTVKLESVNLVKCAIPIDSTQPAYKCDDRAVAVLAIHQNGISQPVFVKLRESDSTVMGDFRVSFLDLINSNGAVLLVERAYEENVRQVPLDQEFKLSTQDTVRVQNTQMFIRMNQMVMMKSYPPQYVAVLDVWNAYDVKTSDQNESVLRQSFKIRPDETLEINGYTIFFARAQGDQTGVFVVKQLSNPDVINVRVNEPFGLQVNQAARVLEANLRIDLLETRMTRCATAEDTRCIGGSVAVISVSDFLGINTAIGKTVPLEVAQKTAISADAQIVSAEESIVIPMPPLPFKTIELSEGSEVTINDYTIKATAVGSGKAEFVVRKKPLNNTLKIEIANGWNLFSLPGEIEAENNGCETSSWKIFEYRPKENRYERVQKPIEGKAYWIYNPGKQCTVRASIRNPVSISQLDSLVVGWNFVPFTTDMIGKKLTDLGNCKIRAAYLYHPNNPENGRWQGGKAINWTISESNLGSAVAVYVTSACQLGNSNENPPELPDVETEEGKFSIQPTQCQTNPWEIWHNDENRQYIRAPTEEEIIKEWLSVKFGIELDGYRQMDADPDQVVCSACSCPRGDTIEIKVTGKDLYRLDSLGFVRLK